MKKLLSILFFLLLAVLYGLFMVNLNNELKAGMFTRGRQVYKNTVNEDKVLNRKTENQSDMDPGTSTVDASPSKVIYPYEFWDKNGKRHTGTYKEVDPVDVKLGVLYGANGSEYTGEYSTPSIIYSNVKYAVLSTGQNVSYLEGDDGDLRNGYTGGYTNSSGQWEGNTRFSNNGDGTITDKLTKLMWVQNITSGGQVTWYEAVTNAKNCVVGGHTDWHLPTVREFMSLLDFNSDSPTMLMPRNDPFGTVFPFKVWTSTTFARSTGSAYHFYMYDGLMQPIAKSTATGITAWYCRDAN